MGSDLKTLASRKQVLNHLKNGNFLRVPRQFTYEHDYAGYSGLSRVYKTIYTYDRTTTPPTRREVPGFGVNPQPDGENYLAFWDVFGSEAIVGINQDLLSRDGGNCLTIEFMEDGSVTFRQLFENFDRFKGHPISFGLSGYKGRGTVKVQASVNVGSETLDFRPFYSRYFGAYYRMVTHTDVPLSATQFDVSIKFDGMRGDSVAFSGAALAMGSYLADLPYSDNMAESAIPSGVIIITEGQYCPPGYRVIEDDTYLYATLGDPNAFRGDCSGEEDASMVMGKNYHDHGKIREEEQEPTAFEVSETGYASPPIDPGGARDLNNLKIPGQGYRGPRVKIMPVEHTHLIGVDNTPIEPPFVKVRICERI